MSSANAMTDRICLANNGAINPRISAHDLMSCGLGVTGFGCMGGFPIKCFQYAVARGVTTGGPFGSGVGCMPDAIPPKDRTSNKTNQGDWSEQLGISGLPVMTTPLCTETCTSGKDTVSEIGSSAQQIRPLQNAPLDYPFERYYFENAYTLPNDPTQIMAELMANGPPVAAFTVYEDFIHYKSGVYQPHSDQVLGGHAVRVIGWGTERGTPYWLVANSWSTFWGDQGNYLFRFIYI